MYQNSKSRKAVAKNQAYGITEVIIGGIFSIFFGYGTFVSFITIASEGDLGVAVAGTILMAFIFGLFVYLAVDGIQRLCFIRTFKYYLKHLCQEQSHFIDQLAQTLDTPPVSVRKRLEKMITMGYLAFTYIDDETNKISCTMPSVPLR